MIFNSKITGNKYSFKIPRTEIIDYPKNSPQVNKNGI